MSAHQLESRLGTRERAPSDLFDRANGSVEDGSLAERIEEQRWEAALVDLVASDARERLGELVQEIARVPKLVHSTRRREQLRDMADAVREAANRLELSTTPRSRLKRRAVG